MRDFQGNLIDENGNSLQKTQYENETGHCEGGDRESPLEDSSLVRTDMDKLDLVMDTIKGLDYESWEKAKASLITLNSLLEECTSERELSGLRLKMIRGISYSIPEKEDESITEFQRLEKEALMGEGCSPEEAEHKALRLGTTKSVIGQRNRYKCVARATPYKFDNVGGVSYRGTKRGCIIKFEAYGGNTGNINADRTLSRLRHCMFTVESISRLELLVKAPIKDVKLELLQNVNLYDLEVI